MVLNPYAQWIEREAPLAACPQPWCRRARACRNAGTEMPCFRTHEDMDDVRNALADKLDALTREMVAQRGYELPPCSPYELDLRMGEMKRLLQEADADDTERRKKAKVRP